MTVLVPTPDGAETVSYDRATRSAGVGEVCFADEEVTGIPTCDDYAASITLYTPLLPLEMGMCCLWQPCREDGQYFILLFLYRMGKERLIQQMPMYTHNLESIFCCYWIVLEIWIISLLISWTSCGRSQIRLQLRHSVAFVAILITIG